MEVKQVRAASAILEPTTNSAYAIP